METWRLSRRSPRLYFHFIGDVDVSGLQWVAFRSPCVTSRSQKPGHTPAPNVTHSELLFIYNAPRLQQKGRPVMTRPQWTVVFARASLKNKTTNDEGVSMSRLHNCAAKYVIVFIPFELFSASDSEDEGSIKGDIYKRQIKTGSGNLLCQLFVCVNVPTCTHPSHTWRPVYSLHAEAICFIFNTILVL